MIRLRTTLPRGEKEKMSRFWDKKERTPRLQDIGRPKNLTEKSAK